MSPLRCAVIGVGHLGSRHAEKYAAHPGCELVAVVDINENTAESVARKVGSQPLDDYESLLGDVDAVSIAVPTQAHFRVAGDFLDAGVHVLLEKPIAVTVEEADALVQLAARRDCVFAIGHLERFNTAFMELNLNQEPPRFVTADRLAPFVARGADVDVVRDLMIHDIDIVLDLVKSEVDSIDALGGSVLTADIDIANARLRFRNGCVANITASRISMKPERKMRLFLSNHYVSIDFLNHHVRQCRIGEADTIGGMPKILSEDWAFGSGDALAAEIDHFLTCVRERKPPLVDGRVGRNALAVAIEIRRQIDRAPSRTGWPA